MWQDNAKCAGQDVNLFDLAEQVDTRSNKQDTAKKLCEGCPVIAECAADELNLVERSFFLVRAGHYPAHDGLAQAEHRAWLETIAKLGAPDMIRHRKHRGTRDRPGLKKVAKQAEQFFETSRKEKQK